MLSSWRDYGDGTASGTIDDGEHGIHGVARQHSGIWWRWQVTGDQIDEQGKYLHKVEGWGEGAEHCIEQMNAAGADLLARIKALATTPGVRSVPQ